MKWNVDSYDYLWLIPVYVTYAYFFMVIIAGSDNKVFIWNVGLGEPISEIDFPDIPLSVAWNWDGSRIAVACKDRKVRIVEPRTAKLLRVSTLQCMYYITF